MPNLLSEDNIEQAVAIREANRELDSQSAGPLSRLL